MSTAVLVVGAVAVVGGGAAAAVAVTSDGGSDEPSESYEGPLSGQRTVVSTGRAGGAVISTCSWTSAISATLTVTLSRRSDGTVSGMLDSMFTETEVSRSCGSPSGASYVWRCQVAGTAAQLGCRDQRDMGFQTNTLEFSGALSGTSLTGTVSYTTGGSNTGANGETFTHSGASTFPVTLTRR